MEESIPVKYWQQAWRMSPFYSSFAYLMKAQFYWPRSVIFVATHGIWLSDWQPFLFQLLQLQVAQPARWSHTTQSTLLQIFYPARSWSLEPEVRQQSSFSLLAKGQDVKPPCKWNHGLGIKSPFLHFFSQASRRACLTLASARSLTLQKGKSFNTKCSPT